MTDTGDRVFLAEGLVTVTQTRFVFKGDTYAMANVSSCRTRYSDETDALKKFLLYAAIVASIILGGVLAISVEPIVGGIGGIAGIVGSFIFIRPKYKLYHLYLGTNSGEVKALWDTSQHFVRQVERAVNDAIVARG